MINELSENNIVEYLDDEIEMMKQGMPRDISKIILKATAINNLRNFAILQRLEQLERLKF